MYKPPCLEGILQVAEKNCAINQSRTERDTEVKGRDPSSCGYAVGQGEVVHACPVEIDVLRRRRRDLSLASKLTECQDDETESPVGTISGAAVKCVLEGGSERFGVKYREMRVYFREESGQ